MKRELSGKGRVAAVAAFALAFVVLGYLTLVAPERKRASDLTASIDAAHVQLAAARVQTGPRPQPQVLPDAFELGRAMPNSDELANALLDLSRVARETDVAFESVTPLQPIAERGYERVPLTVALRGSFYSLSDFLFRLRTLVISHDGDLRVSGRLFTIDGVDFVEGSGRFPELQATLNLNTFVGGELGSAGAVPSAQAAGASVSAGSTTPNAPSAAAAGGAG